MCSWFRGFHVRFQFRNQHGSHNWFSINFRSALWGKPLRNAIEFTSKMRFSPKSPSKRNFFIAESTTGNSLVYVPMPKWPKKREEAKLVFAMINFRPEDFLRRINGDSSTRYFAAIHDEKSSHCSTRCAHRWTLCKCQATTRRELLWKCGVFWV